MNIILGSRRLNAEDMEHIRRASAVILPQGRIEDFHEAYLNAHARFFPNYDIRFKYPGKIGQSRLFEELGLSFPRTTRWPSLAEFTKTHPPPSHLNHEFPFMVKDDRSHEGEGVFFVKNRGDLSRALQGLSTREASGYYGFVTQDYVPSDGNVLRAVIIGRKIITFWKRASGSEQVITTVSKGAAIDRSWRPDLQQKGRAAAELLSAKTGLNLAAVDFLFSSLRKDPIPLFLEINYYFGRKGLGGSRNYYKLLYTTIQEWLEQIGLPPDRVKLV